MFQNRLLTNCLGFIFLVTLFLAFGQVKAASAATLYWVGASGANASVASNWSTTNPTSCSNNVTPSGAAPASGDTLLFDNDCDNSAVWDSSAAATVTGVTLNGSYAGTVTLQRSLQTTSNFTVSGGTFNASNQNLEVDGTFTVSTGSTFRASSGTMTFASTFTVASDTWDNNTNSGGTVTFDGGSAVITCNNATFNQVNITNPTGTKTVSSNCTLPLGNNPSIPATTVNGGTLSGTGTLTASGALNLSSGSNTLSGFSGLVTNSTFTVSGASVDLGTYTTVDLNGTTSFSFSSGTFKAPSGTMTIGRALTVTGGTFDANGGTVEFDGIGTSTLSCNNITFNHVVISQTGTRTVNSNCSFPVGANPTFPGAVTLNGTISGSGLLILNGTNIFNTGSVLSGFSGINSLGNFQIAGANIDLSNYSPVDIDGGFNMSSGSFVAPTSMTVGGNFTVTGGTFDANGGTVTFDGTTATLTCNNVTFNLVSFSHTSGIKTVSSNCSLPLGNNPTVTFSITLNGTLSGSGTLTFVQAVGNTLTLNAGSVLSGLSGLSLRSLTISGATLDLSTYTSVSLVGSFTFSSGTFTAAPFMDFNDGVNITGGTFNHNNGSILFSEDTVNHSSIFNCNNAVFNVVTLNSPTSSKTINSDCSFPLGAEPTVSGLVVLNGTLSGSGRLGITTSFTMNTGSSLVGFNGITQSDSGTFVVAGPDVDFSNYNPVRLNAFTISSGTFTAPSGDMTVRASFINSGGTFNHNNGTIILTNTINQTIAGSTTFYNLTKSSNTGGTFNLTAGTTQTVLGTLTLTGSIGNPLTLQSTAPGTQWNIDPRGDRMISYIKLQDGNNINSTSIALGGTGSVNLGNNTGWDFDAPAIDVSLNSPDHNSYTSSERPTFRWRANSNSMTSISKYKLLVDNGDSGDFEIGDIPSFRTSDLETDKYIARYEGFNDSDNENNYISLQTKSHSSWSSEENDGKLKEGKRTWKVRAMDSSGFEKDFERTLFVDTSAPKTEISSFDGKSLDTSITEYTSNSTPTIIGKITDNLNGEHTDRSVASGPKKYQIKYQLRTFGMYRDYLDETVDLDTIYWTENNTKIDDNTTNKSGKYANFIYKPSKSLENGTYKVTITGFDQTNNSSTTEFTIVVGEASDIDVTVTGIKATEKETADKKKTQDKDENSDSESKTKKNLIPVVEVKVTDSNGNPVEGALVTLHSTPRQATTDVNGIATFRNVERGEHKVIIAYDDYVGEETLSLSDSTVKKYEVAVKVEKGSSATSFSPLAIGVISLLILIIIEFRLKIIRRFIKRRSLAH